MNKSVEELSNTLEEVIDYLNAHKDEKLYITKEGRVVAVMTGISQDSKRIGIAKEEMDGRSITLEELNSIDASDLFN